MKRTSFLLLILLGLTILAALPQMSTHALAATGTWTATVSRITAREDNTATPQFNGNVLVVGGLTNGTSVALNSVERYDSAMGRWAAIASMTDARVEQCAPFTMTLPLVSSTPRGTRTGGAQSTTTEHRGQSH